MRKTVLVGFVETKWVRDLRTQVVQPDGRRAIRPSWPMIRVTGPEHSEYAMLQVRLEPIIGPGVVKDPQALAAVIAWWNGKEVKFPHVFWKGTQPALYRLGEKVEPVSHRLWSSAPEPPKGLKRGELFLALPEEGPEVVPCRAALYIRRLAKKPQEPITPYRVAVISYENAAHKGWGSHWFTVIDQARPIPQKGRVRLWEEESAIWYWLESTSTRAGRWGDLVGFVLIPAEQVARLARRGATGYGGGGAAIRFEETIEL